MAEVAIIASAQNGTGPFTYTFKALNPCDTGISFSDLQGNTGSPLVVSSPNPSKPVTITFDESVCTADQVLAIVEVTVVDSAGPCSTLVSQSVNNPCYNFTASIQSGIIDSSGQQRHAVNAGNGGATPFTYAWTIDAPNGLAAIVGAVNKSYCDVVISGLTSYTISVTVTDANGCVVSVDKLISATGLAPELNNFSQQLLSGSITPIVIDILTLAQDVDGSINLSTITEESSPTKGITVIDTTQGTITYTPIGGNTGTDTWEVSVMDNTGKRSNTAVMNIVHTPAVAAPTIVQDTPSTPCNTPITIDVLANDTPGNADIDPSSLQIAMQPFNGTAEITPDNKIKYTPNSNYDGPDIIRYLVSDWDSLEAPQTSMNYVSVTVQTCCDAHTGDITITCTGDDDVNIEFTAAGSGTIPALSTDTMEVDTGGGYGVGTTGAVGVTCTPPTDTAWVDLAFTDASGNFSTGSGNIVRTDLGGGKYKVRITYGAPIATAVVATMDAFLQASLKKNMILDLTVVDGSGNNYKFNSASITNVIAVPQYLEFIYDSLVAPDGICSADMTTELTGLTWSAGSDTGTTFTKITRKVYGGPGNTVKFRRTVTRSNGCANVVVEKEVTVTDINDVCANTNYSVATLQAGGSEAPLTDLDVWQVTKAGALTIGEVRINHATRGLENAIKATYTIATQSQLVEDDVQDYLNDNGGGTVDVFVTSDNTIIIHLTISSIHTPVLITVNTGTENFTQVT